MKKFYVITNGIDGGFATLKFNDREAILVYEDKSLAGKMMQQLPKAALIELELESREKLSTELESFLSVEERSRIEIMFPDADEYWPLIKQSQ